MATAAMCSRFILHIKDQLYLHKPVQQFQIELEKKLQMLVLEVLKLQISFFRLKHAFFLSPYFIFIGQESVTFNDASISIEVSDFLCLPNARCIRFRVYNRYENFALKGFAGER